MNPQAPLRGRAVVLALAVLLAACVALAGSLAPNAAAFGEPSANINGQVQVRDGPVLDSFNHNSDGVDNWIKSDSADDPDSNATGKADLTYTTTSGAASVTVDARGNASATSGTLVRMATGSSGFSKEFQVTVASRFSATGTVSVASTAAHCCVGAEARLIQTDPGTNVFLVGVNTGDSARSVSESGILQPGVYRLFLQASAGMGFGAVALANDAGSAAFNVRFTLTAATDTDGDALLDVWETDGIDTNNDGTIDLDLPAMGAHPRKKDIFLEVDFMAPHEIEQAAIDRLVIAFAIAPVANPDGSTGIALHVDNGPGSTMNPRTGASWGTRSRHDEIGHLNVTGAIVAGAYDWGAFDVHKAGHFESAREQAFHYAISAHGHAGIASGNARGIPSSDLLITLGAGCQANTGSDCTLDAQSQAGTLMHELGHNLGLHHGGNDDTTNKPSYLSVMHYFFQLTGLFHADLSTSIDYSRFGVAMNEASLDEATGLGAAAGSAAAGFLTLARCPNGSQVMWPLLAGPLDFNCDGTTGGVVSSDTNADGTKTAFTGFTDWPNIVFKGGGVGAQGAPVLPAQTPLIEPPLTELLEAKRTFEQYVPVPRALTPPALPAPPANPSAQPGAIPQLQTATPALRFLRLKPTAFAVLRRDRRDRRRIGATITYSIPEAGRVRFRFERSLPGHRAAARCVPVSRAPGGAPASASSRWPAASRTPAGAERTRSTSAAE